MKDQYSPVSDDEFLLRRVPANFDYINHNLSVPVQRVAFEPHKKRDIDGLSVYRELFVFAKDVAAAGRSPAGYYVVRLRAQDYRNLDLSLRPSPRLDDLPGHTLVPELNAASMSNRADKEKSKALQRELAKLATKYTLLGPFPSNAQRY